MKSKDIKVSKRNYVLIRLLYESGMRISEALNIRLEDIKRNNSGSYVISIIGKSLKTRSIILHPDLYEHIKEIYKGGYVFKSIKGNQLKRTKFYKTIRSLGNKLLKKHISPHTLRHNHINNMLQKCPSKIQAISQYAGHSSAQITLDMYVYQEITVKDIQRLAVG